MKEKLTTSRAPTTFYRQGWTVYVLKLISTKVRKKRGSFPDEETGPREPAPKA